MPKVTMDPASAASRPARQVARNCGTSRMMWSAASASTTALESRLSATAVALKRDSNAVVLALAADHIILDVPQFRATCLAGREAAEAGSIVTFGIKPTEPKTSYGYILPGT